MPSRVACDSGHYGGRCREAAIEISKHGSLSPCNRCGKPRHYVVNQYYPRIEETHEYVVEKVVRIYSPEDAEEGYDPMVFSMRHRKLGHIAVWPFYWVKDKKGRWRVGQFPPILDLEEYKRAIKELEESKSK